MLPPRPRPPQSRLGQYNIRDPEQARDETAAVDRLRFEVHQLRELLEQERAKPVVMKATVPSKPPSGSFDLRLRGVKLRWVMTLVGVISAGGIGGLATTKTMGEQTAAVENAKLDKLHEVLAIQGEELDLLRSDLGKLRGALAAQQLAFEQSYCFLLEIARRQGAIISQPKGLECQSMAFEQPNRQQPWTVRSLGTTPAPPPPLSEPGDP